MLNKVKSRLAGKKFFQFKKLSELVSSLFFYFAILFFIIGFGFRDAPPPFGWYQQFMPNLNGRQISDITFIDSLNGFAVTPYTANDTAYIVRTFNGGDNWNIIFRQPTNTVGGFNRIQFLNINTGFTCGNFLWKTTNSGINWFNVNTSGIFPMNMFVLNQDTIWLVNSDALVGGVFFTSNGGANWIQQYYQYGYNPSHIYMFNARIGFMDAGGLQKTTDGGTTWTPIAGADYFTHMYFTDSLTGWKCNGYMKKTTDGGFNWILQTLPQTNFTAAADFSYVNIDTIWAVGGYKIYPNSQLRGVVYRTTNGGQNWLYQIPDTSIHASDYSFDQFINKSIGWANTGYVEIHTTTGGDSIFYTSIKKISSQVPDKFILFQNYPNPFNPKTIINYELTTPPIPPKGGEYEVILKVYNITGAEIKILVTKKQNPGKYQVQFDGTNYSSGVYFYGLYVDGVLIDTKKMVLLK